MTVDTLLKVLIFPTGTSKDFLRGKPKLLWQLDSFRKLRSRLVKCRTNTIPLWNTFLLDTSLFQFFRHCPIIRHACFGCPYQIGNQLYMDVGVGSKACVLFSLRHTREISTFDSIIRVDDIIARADKYAKEQGWV